MTKASDNAFPSILITEGTEPSAPAAGKQRLYIDSTTHHLTRTNSSGTETDIEAASGGMAADSLWDAKGDLAGGTGANTAAKLTVGANGSELVADSAQSTGLKWQAQPVSAGVDGDGLGDFTTSSTSFVDLTGASITVTTLARKVKVGFMCTALNSGTNITTFTVSVDASDKGGSLGYARHQQTANNIAEGIALTYMTPVALSAGSHTFKIRVLASAGTSTVKNASASAIWHMWVEECAA